MDFANTALSDLMATVPADAVDAAEWANLCLEERVSAPRQAAYEARVDQPAEWRDWRAAHFRYVQQDVRRPHPLSVAFDAGDALRPHIEAKQELYRLERIDGLLKELRRRSVRRRPTPPVDFEPRRRAHRRPEGRPCSLAHRCSTQGLYAVPQPPVL